LATLTDAHRIEVIHPDLRREPVSRWQIGSFAASLASASVASLTAARQCEAELKRLLNEPRISAVASPSKDVLYVNANMWFGIKAGGSVGHVAGVANGLSRRGYQVEYAAASPCVMADPSVRYQTLQAPSVFGYPIELNFYRFQQSVVGQLLAGIQSCPPGFLYQRMSLANYAGVVLSRAVSRPLILEYNGSEVWVQKNWGRGMHDPALALLAEDVCLKHAHVVVTVSDVLRDELMERGVEAERIVVYPNCIDPAVFDPARFSQAEGKALRARYGIPEDAVVATFVGTFGKWHGVDVLAETIRRMVDEDAEWLKRHKVHFLLVGDGIFMPKVRETLADEKYTPFYTLTGLVQQDQAPVHLAASDFLLSPHVPNADGSRFFGSPTKLFEYMSMGRGIVASDLDQIGEVLSPATPASALPSGEPGEETPELAVLCRPGDVGELAHGIRFLVERPAWRRRLGENARAQALAHYTWDHHVDAILQGLRARQGE